MEDLLPARSNFELFRFSFSFTITHDTKAGTQEKKRQSLLARRNTMIFDFMQLDPFALSLQYCHILFQSCRLSCVPTKAFLGHNVAPWQWVVRPRLQSLVSTLVPLCQCIKVVHSYLQSGYLLFVRRRGRLLRYVSVGPCAPGMCAGSLPSAKSLSSFAISSRLIALWTAARIRSFSSSV